MDAASLIALQAASTRLTTAQTAAQQAATAATVAETAATTAATANPVVAADVTAANATVTQARVAVLMANNEVEAATAAVNAMMVKPAKAFKPHGQAPPFDIEERKDSFDVWETQWKIFVDLSTIKDLVPLPQQPKYLATVLLSCMSPNTLKAVVNAGLGGTAMEDVAQIIEYLRERCNAGKNKRVWRQQFKSCTQRQGLSIDNWLCELRDLARKCEFETCCNRCDAEQMLDQFLFGLSDRDVQLKLFDVGPTLTIDQAISTARTCETSKLLAEQLKTGASVQGIKSKYQRQKSVRVTAAAAATAKVDASTKSTGATCDKCGFEIRPGGHYCPAKNATCRKCNGIGHFKAVCDAKAKVSAIYVSQVSSAEDDTVTVSIKARGEPAKEVRTLPDTGSTLDAIPPCVYHRQFQDVPLDVGIHAETATGNHIKSLGSFKAQVDWKANDGSSRPIQSTVHVLENLKQPVLSKITQQKLGMIPAEYPNVRVHQVATVRPSDEQRAKDLSKLMAEYPKVFDGVCREMDCEPVHLTLREGAIPVQIRGHRNVAEPLIQMFKDELMSQVEQGLVRPVPPEAITPFISGVVTMPKDSVSGGVRITVDYRELNKWLVGTIFPNKTPFEAVRSIPTGMNYFTMFDGLKGYHMIPLDEESMALTTFSTPFGLFQYTRLPMGICHAGDSFGSRYYQVFGDLPIAGCVEDICTYAATYPEMLDLARQIIERADKHNVSFNAKKTIGAFAAEEGDFAGYRLNSEGYSPSPELTRAIQDFPRPADKTDLRSFNGLCQQVGLFSDEIAEALAPFSPLLKKQVAFTWLPDHDKAFIKARRLLSQVPALAYYDPKRPTALFTDASRLCGLGFVLKQQQQSGEWKMVQAGSRLIVPAESRYAMIELECLAAAWAMKKCKSFLEGLPSFEVVLDHRPLIPILNDYTLDQLDNQRLLRLRLQMSRFCFHARWVPGKENVEADALSRSPVDQPTEADLLGEGPTSYTARKAVVNMIAEWSGSKEETADLTLDGIKAAAAVDRDLQDLHEVIMNGFPNEKTNLAVNLRPFWNKRESLAIDEKDGMIVCGARVVIPRAKVPEMLKILVGMHQGETKMRQRARLSVYWPNMDVDISNAAKSCDSCISRLPSPPAEPLHLHKLATRPFQFVHADIGEDDGRQFLVIVDQFSGWPDVTLYDDKNTSANRLVNSCRPLFATMGAPEGFWSDNQPFKAAFFQDFLAKFNVSWHSSSPHYPQSNGRAEAEIKQIKKLVCGSKTDGRVDPDKLAQALMLYRNAPRCGGGPSPAESLFNRPIRDGLPAHTRSFKKEWQREPEELERRVVAAREKSEKFHNATAHSLAVLKVDDHVLIQDPDTSRWSIPGKVIEVGPNRDYLVRTENGKEFRRNRRHLLRRVPVMPGMPGPAMSYAEAAGGQRPVPHQPSSVAAVPEPPEAAVPADEPAQQPPARRTRQRRPRDRQPTRQQPKRSCRKVFDFNNPDSV